jgi:hypothetical protein
MMKKVRPEDSPGDSAWPVQPIYTMKITGLETSPIASTWPVQPIYMMKKCWSRDFPKRLHDLYSLYI